MNNENEARKDELTEQEVQAENTSINETAAEDAAANKGETEKEQTPADENTVSANGSENDGEQGSVHNGSQHQYTAQPQNPQYPPQYANNPYGYNPQNGQQQNAGYYHTAYTGNYYDPRYQPGSYQPNGYQPMNEQPNGKKAKKRSSGKGVIAAIIATCVVLSAIVGAGGAFITNRIINNNNISNIPANNAQNGVITDREDSETQNAVSNSGNPSVIFKTTENPDNTGKYSDNPIVNAAAVAGVSVVEITTETVQTNTFYGQYVTQGAGSGVIITEDGYIITCAHVIDGASAVTVRLKDGGEYPAKIIGSDSQTDIAVIKLDGVAGLEPAVIGNSDNLLVGETAIAIGNPLGELGGSVSSGIISALDREIEIDGDRYNLLQTTAAINPGNSGGGLFNVNGELIGVVNAKQAGSSIEGLGFSIPINHAIDIAEQLINNGYIKGRVRLGIEVLEVNSSTNTYQIYNQYPQLMNYITAYGVYFIDYDTAQSGELKFGDRIVAIDGVTVEDYADIRSLLGDYEIGDTVTVTVARLTTNGRVSQSKMVDVSLTLIESVPIPSAETANTEDAAG